MKKANVLVVGAGMYVCGRGTTGVGTVLPALFKANANQLIDEIYVAAHSVNGVEIVKTKAKEANALMGTTVSVTIFPGLDEAIDKISHPRCAIIATPDDTHTEIAKKLMKEGFHLLVVKPLAPTVLEVEQLIEAQVRYDVYGMVEFHKRFDRANLKLKEAIVEGRIGDPLYFIVEYSQRKIIPTKIFKNWVEKTNVFQYLGIHYVDIIYFCTKAKPIRVMATGQNGFLKDQKISAFDSVQCSIEWMGENGKSFFSYHHTNWIDPESTTAMSDQRIKVIGTKGRVESDQKYRGLMMVNDGAQVEEPNPDFCQFYLKEDGKKEIQGYGVDSIHTFLKDFGEIINNKRTWKDFEGVRPTFSDSLIPTRIIEAANRSLKQNFDWIKIEL
ncbi:MAG: Gfo/Idh/MocA family oxidoreductase [Bacteriovorax sp.]|jgi:predicted dehydrogenase